MLSWYHTCKYTEYISITCWNKYEYEYIYDEFIQRWWWHESQCTITSDWSDLQMPTEIQVIAHNEYENTNIAQCLNLMPSKYNEWKAYRTAMEISNEKEYQYEMNINTGSLINEYEYKANTNMDNYKSSDKNIDINECSSKNAKNLTDNHYKMIYEANTGGVIRDFNDTVDIYDTALEVEYGLFENPLESTLLMYFIENNFMTDLSPRLLSLSNFEHYDDTITSVRCSTRTLRY